MPFQAATYAVYGRAMRHASSYELAPERLAGAEGLLQLGLRFLEAKVWRGA